jgi:hypothetical protein
MPSSTCRRAKGVASNQIPPAAVTWALGGTACAGSRERRRDGLIRRGQAKKGRIQPEQAPRVLTAKALREMEGFLFERAAVNLFSGLDGLVPSADQGDREPVTRLAIAKPS